MIMGINLISVSIFNNASCWEISALVVGACLTMASLPLLIKRQYLYGSMYIHASLACLAQQSFIRHSGTLSRQLRLSVQRLISYINSKALVKTFDTKYYPISIGRAYLA
jgi:hypothetical protein